MNKHHREEHHKHHSGTHHSGSHHHDSKMIIIPHHDEHDHMKEHALDAIMRGKKEEPSTHHMSHGGHSNGHKGDGSTNVGIPYHQHHDKEKPYTDTTYNFKKGGDCHKRKHMAAGGVGKIRHEQYY